MTAKQPIPPPRNRGHKRPTSPAVPKSASKSNGSIDDDPSIMRLDDLIETLRIARETFVGNPPILIKMGFISRPMQNLEVKLFESEIVLS